MEAYKIKYTAPMPKERKTFNITYLIKYILFL